MKRFELITRSNFEDFIGFYQSLDSSTLRSFRYYENRGVDYVLNVRLPLLCYVDNKLVGYCHLDDDDTGITWYGIVISQGFRGMGYSKLLLKELLSFAKLIGVQRINLSVDVTNIPAIKSYTSVGFKKYDRVDNIEFMRISLFL